MFLILIHKELVMRKLNLIIKFLEKIIFLLLILFCEISIAHEGHNHGPSVATSVSFDKSGNLWRVQERQGFVVVDSSEYMSNAAEISGVYSIDS